jgi:hypothetical protein
LTGFRLDLFGRTPRGGAFAGGRKPSPGAGGMTSPLSTTHVNGD